MSAATPKPRSHGERAEAENITSADYARAEKFMAYNADRLVSGEIGRPVWLPSGRFWYRKRDPMGLKFVLVDPARKTRRPLFDEEAVALAINRSVGEQCTSRKPVIDVIDVSSDENTISLQVGSSCWRCNTDGSGCVSIPALDSKASRSPDGHQEVFIRDYNLWSRDVRSGAEAQLTTDGFKDFGYATDNSARRHTDRPIVSWSPDSKCIATFQQDQRGVGEMYLVRTQRKHPNLEAWKYAMPGDAVVPVIHRVVIHVRTSRLVRLKMAPDFVRSASWLGLASERTNELEGQWSRDSAQFAFISISRDHKHARLRVADAEGGFVREVLDEQAHAFYETALCASLVVHRTDGLANWRYLAKTNEAIWYSARDNWSHLYLYDAASGKLKQQITSGNWNVVAMLAVDEEERVLYFLAVGREPERHPYFESFYRIGLDGENLELLTPEDATHAISIAPSMSFFVDSHSRPGVPATAVLRKRNGELILVLEHGDISRLTEAGWRPPEMVTVKARDGLTDLYGLLFKPSHFDATRSYPIVNAIYSGAIQGSVIPRGLHAQWGGFSATYGLLNDAQSLAELGFIVVMIDGVGTPLRSCAFHQAHYGNYGDGTLPDQIAGMRELATRHPWIDIGRAGIYGHSGGGYRAARAMFVYPEFFKVGVSIAGNHDPMSYQDEYGEKFIGMVERLPSGASNYDSQSNLCVARNLKGKLLLIHGMMDDNVPPYHTLMLVDALVEANKDFDLLLLPQQTHAIANGAAGRYLVRRHWDYFVRHLSGIEPPKEYQMERPAETQRLPDTDQIYPAMWLQ